MRLSVNEAGQLSTMAVRSLGFNAADSSFVSDCLMDAALRGLPGGLSRFSAFVQQIKNNGRGKPMKITRKTRVSASVDGSGQPGYLVAGRVTKLVIEKALRSGMAIVAGHNTQNTGALGYYAELAAREGLVALVVSTGRPQIAPLGTSEPLLGTNPLSFGFPAKPNPIVWDATTASLSLGELAAHKAANTLLPAGIAFDSNGNSTQDAAAVLQNGALRALGGRRGSGLNISIHLLALLSGMPAVASPSDTGFLMIALQPDLLLPKATYSKRISEFAKRLRQSRIALNEPKARLPYDRSHAERSRQREDGLEIPDDIYSIMKEMAGGKVRKTTRKV